jgi:hypothetical protein
MHGSIWWRACDPNSQSFQRLLLVFSIRLFSTTGLPGRQLIRRPVQRIYARGSNVKMQSITVPRGVDLSCESSCGIQLAHVSSRSTNIIVSFHVCGPTIYNKNPSLGHPQWFRRLPMKKRIQSSKAEMGKRRERAAA